MTFVRLSNLTKFYPTFSPRVLAKAAFDIFRLSPPNFSSGEPAVNNLSLRFSEGETVGIIGPNGAGKSTLLQLIAGLLKPTSGEIEIKGQITSIFTLGTGLREAATGRENIRIHGELNGLDANSLRDFERDVVEFSELGDFIDQPLRTYSTGMKSRLAFSMIINVSPDILIVDETLSAGDAFFAQKASQKVKEICSKGKIVFIVSHSSQTILDMCNRCLWMDKGKLIADGIPSEIVQKYLDHSRQAGERELIQRFKNVIEKARILGPVKNVDFLQDLQTSSALDSNRPTDLVIEIGEVNNPRLELKIRIEKCDGTLIDESLVTCSPKATVRGRLEKLMLSPSTYLLGVSLLADQMVIDHRLIPFLVTAESVPTGGMPTLLSDFNLNVKRMENHAGLQP